MVLAQGGRRIPSQPPSPSQVPLQNRCEALYLEGQADDSEREGVSVESTCRSTQSTRLIKISSIKIERRVVIVGDLLLRGKKVVVW